MKRILLWIIGFGLLTLAGLSSCKQTPKGTKAIVKVIDLAGTPQANATVKFSIDPSANPDSAIANVTLVTDANGKVTKEYDNGVVIQLYAKKDNLEGRGYVLLEPGDTKEVTITLK